MNVDEAVMFLKLLAGDVGTICIERRTEKDAQKAFECIKFLESRIEELTEIAENV